MKRFALALAFGSMLALPSVVHGQAVVRGVQLGATVRLTDSRLNPGTPVTMTWDGAKKEWRGPGNGMTYRLVYESDFDWFIRADLVDGGTAYSYGLVWQPSTQLRGISPLVWTGVVPTPGPMRRAYGYFPVNVADPRDPNSVTAVPPPDLTITVTP